MEWEIRFGGDPEDVLATTWGVASLSELEAFTHELVDDPRTLPGMNALVDHRRLDWRSMSSAQLRTRANQLVAVSPRLAGGRVATVVSGPSEYGIQRMTQAYVDDGVKHERAVFYTLDDARAWLRHH